MDLNNQFETLMHQIQIGGMICFVIWNVENMCSQSRA